MNKKKGFTLAEVLIALGIVSIMAALMASAFNQVKPDKTKMLYLKAYDSLVEAVQLMINDPAIYNPVYVIPGGSRSYNVQSYPFLDLSKPRKTSLLTNNYTDGDTLKFGKLLGEILNGYDTSANGTTSYTFTTNPGNLSWTVIPSGRALSDSTGGSVNFVHQVGLNIDGSPDTFNFCVFTDGRVNAMDTAGQTYINNRKNVKNGNNISGPAPVTQCRDVYDVQQVSGNYFRVYEGTNYSLNHPEEATNSHGGSGGNAS